MKRVAVVVIHQRAAKHNDCAIASAHCTRSDLAERVFVDAFDAYAESCLAPGVSALPQSAEWYPNTTGTPERITQMTDRNASAARALADCWRERLRKHDFAWFREAVRHQPQLSAVEMIAFDEAVSNPYPQAHPCYRLLAAHTAAWYEAIQDDPRLPHAVDRTGRQRRVAIYCVAPELGVNAATLERALSGTSPMQRETAHRLYAALAEQDALAPDNIDEETVAALWRRATRKSAPLPARLLATHPLRVSDAALKAR